MKIKKSKETIKFSSLLIILFLIISLLVLVRQISNKTKSFFAKANEAENKKGVSWSYGASGGNASAEKVFSLSQYVYRHWTHRELCDSYGTRYHPLVQAHHVSEQQADIDYITQKCPGSSWLIWNEPDLVDYDNVPPTTAPEMYKALVEDNIKVKDSNAVIIFGGLSQLAFSGLESTWWLTQFKNNFYAQYGRYPQIQGIHVHYYPDADTYNNQDRYNTSYLINYIAKIRSYMQKSENAWLNNKELWLTEVGFNCGYKACDSQQIKTYIQNMTNNFNNSSAINRYFWFPVENVDWPPGQLQDFAPLLVNNQETEYGTLWKSIGSSPTSTIIPTNTLTPTVSPSPSKVCPKEYGYYCMPSANCSKYYTGIVQEGYYCSNSYDICCNVFGRSIPNLTPTKTPTPTPTKYLTPTKTPTPTSTIIPTNTLTPTVSPSPSKVCPKEYGYYCMPSANCSKYYTGIVQEGYYCSKSYEICCNVFGKSIPTQ